MATSLFIDSSLCSRFSAPLSHFSSSKPSKTLEPKTLTVRFLNHRPSPAKPLLGPPSKPLLGFSRFYPITINRSIHRRSTFMSCLSAQKDEVTLNGKEDRRYPSDVKTLIGFYQEALSNGDEKTVSEIEAIICGIEKEKNKLDLRVLSLSAEIASGKEKYIRVQADFDNFRKNFQKDRLTAQANARVEVIERLLSIVDSFERFRQQIKPETEKEKSIGTSYQGIYRQFVEVLRSLHVSAVAAVGKPFDPLLHEAIAREESQEFKEGIVVQELNRGFLLGDRVLRPAKVKVSSGPGRKKAPLTSEQSSSKQPTTTSDVDAR